MHYNHLCYIFERVKINVQILLQGRNLDKNNDGSSILKIISNEQAVHILAHIVDTPMSSWEICSTTGFPLTQVYRWVRKFQKAGLVRVTGATNAAGKKYFMYQSKVSSIKLSLGANPITQLEII